MTTQLSQHDEADEPREDDDFLRFWQEHRAKQDLDYKTILGVRVAVPTSVPLAVEDQLAVLQDADSVDEVEPLVQMLFGAGVFEQWKANGVNNEQLQVLFAWGMANGSGKPTTFEDAVKLVAEAEGKARTVPNRAVRRASSKTRASAKGGGSSSRTSAASTASKRPKSPTSKRTSS